MKNTSYIFSQFFSSKTLLLGVLIFIALVLPLYTAQANFIGDAVAWAIEHSINPVLNLIFGLVAGIFFDIFTAVAGTMNTVITFLMSINVAPNAPGTPPFVNEAWGYSRNLVNIVFILILTFIGLATILRLQSYQMQKTLPSLIIIALLVNFSGVLVGFTADMGNLVTKVFLKDAVGDPSVWNVNPWSGISFTASPVLQLVRILFYSLAISIFFIVMLLFAVRVIILWTLAILAPIAFGAYVLPGTKKYWTQWLQALIQWSIVGIPISFFLFFARKAIQMGAVGDPGTLSAQVTGFFAPLTALVLLFIGVTLSMQMAPAGAQGVINFAKKLPKRITETRLGAKAAAWGASKTQGALSGLAPVLKKLEGKGPLGKVAGMALRPAGWAAKGTNRLAGGKLLEYAASKRRMPLPKNFDQMSEEELAGNEEKGIKGWAQTQNLGGEDLVQFAARMQDKKKYKHTTKFFKDTVNAAAEKVSDKRWLQPDIGSLLDVTPEATTEKTLLDLEPTVEAKKEREAKIRQTEEEIREGAKNNPALQAEITKWTDAGKTVGDLAAAKIYAQELKPGDIPNILNPTSLAFSLAVPDASPETLHRLFASFEKDKVEKVLNTPGGLNDRSNTKEKLIELQKSNPRLTRAIFNSSGYQHIDLEARKVLREEFGDNYKRFLNETSPQPLQPAPLRTTHEINAEIGERTRHIQDIEQQIAPLEAKKTANTNTLREWQNRGIDQSINRLVEQENRLTSEIDELTDELGRIPKERRVLQDVTDNRFAAMPAGSPKTRAEVEHEVRTEYEQKYRPLMTNQIKQEVPFIRWSAEQAGVTQNQAMQDRIRQLYDNLRLRDIMPPVTPAPSSAERKVFEDIARDSAPLPPTTDPERGRKLAGSIAASLQLIEQIEGQINRLSQEVAEVERRHGDASNQRSMRDRYQTQLDSFNRRKEDIRTQLGLTP